MTNELSRQSDPSITLLDILLNRDHPTTITSLANLCHLPYQRVIQLIDQLTCDGCRFERHPQQGIRLMETGIGVWKDYLSHRGDRNRLIEVYAETTSTQDAARRVIDSRGRSCDGAIIIAGRQTNGRGRLGRRWHAPEGRSLTFSRIALFTDRPGRQTSSQLINHVTFSTSVAVARVMDMFLQAHPLKATIKWPNDIHLDGDKIAGILVETCRTTEGQTAAVIGIGVNISLTPDDITDCRRNDPAMQRNVTSLVMQQVHVDRLKVLAELIQSLDEVLSHDDIPVMLTEWRNRSSSINHHVRLRHNGETIEGHVLDLDPDNGLILRRDQDGTIVHLPAETTTLLV